MSILQSTAEQFVFTTLGGEPTGRTKLELADQAGTHMMSMRAWAWANGVAAESDIVAGEAFIDLPVSFLGFTTTPRVSNTSWTWLELVSLETLERLRRDTTGASGTPYYAALTYQYPPAGGAPIPRLELYPTPSNSVTNGLTYYFRHGWVTWPDEVTAAPLPPWIEPLYIELVKSVGRGWEDDLEHPGKTNEYLEVVARGQIFKMAQEADSVLQPTMGEIKGGVADGWGQTTYLTIGGAGGPI